MTFQTETRSWSWNEFRKAKRNFRDSPDDPASVLKVVGTPRTPAVLPDQLRLIFVHVVSRSFVVVRPFSSGRIEGFGIDWIVVVRCGAVVGFRVGVVAIVCLLCLLQRLLLELHLVRLPNIRPDSFGFAFLLFLQVGQMIYILRFRLFSTH